MPHFVIQPQQERGPDQTSPLPAPYQRPRHHQIFGLTAKPWHSPETFSFASLLESKYNVILEELSALLSLQSYGGSFPLDGG